MDTLYDYELFKAIKEAFYTVFKIDIPEKVIAFVFLSIVALGIIITIYKYIIKPIIQNHKWRKDQLNEILFDYGEYTKWRERRLYIDTGLQVTPPNDYDEPSEAQYQDIREFGQKRKWYLKNSSIDFFINNVFRKNNNNPPYYCILGGSGMGKSTFVVHLVRRYIIKYKEKTLPYPIKMVNCGAKTEDKINYLIDCIDGIDDKNNTILILDALDESNAAINNFSEFFSLLMDRICQFRIVVLTCRTQFFEKYEDEPNLLPVRDPKTKKLKQFKKYYVSPFNDDEIQHYLNKKFMLNFSSKKKAKTIVEKCNQIMARPLLLSYIDDLVNSDIKDYTISKIYEIIIDKWLEREADFAAVEKTDFYKHNLHEFSSEMALCLAQIEGNIKPTDNIIHNYSTIITQKNLKGRSLLNRNSKNEYKFAHKSFMEYFVAIQLFEEKNILIDSIDWTSNDMIPVFLADMINIGYEQFRIIISKYGCRFSFDKYNFPTIHKFRTLDINCSVSDNTMKFIPELIKLIGITQIEIDCNYDYHRISCLLEEYGKENKYQLLFWNYDFQDISLTDFLKPLLHSKLNHIEFYIKDKQTFDSGNAEVLEFLRNISVVIPRYDYNTSISIYYYKGNKCILYTNAFDNNTQ